MKALHIIVSMAAVVAVASSVAALNPDDELWIPAAARGAGSSGSFWMTDLVMMNLGDEPITVEIAWLERDLDNSDAESEVFELESGETLVLEDAILEVFGLATGEGAFHIEVLEDEGLKQSGLDGTIVASSRIYNLDGSETFGQGFEGLTSDAAISASDEDPTHVIGLTDNAEFRSNWYGLNVTLDEDEEPAEAEVLVELLDVDGEVFASRQVVLPPLAPVLEAVSGLGGPELDAGALRFTMIEGEGIFGGSKVDELSNDPTTLEAHWSCGSDDELGFTAEFQIDRCTFATTGTNPFYIPLEPGARLSFEGEEDGELVELRITVLEELETIDGVETRVVEEYETVDGEVVEISRNFLAFCVETGSVFYFGEDVDIYENGQVVSHAGAWRAGEDDARPGILMPGTVLLGSRYYQEVAPDVALDRAHHVAMDVSVDTPAGTFEDCLQVDESTPFEPGISVKLYAPGVGLVQDDFLELVEASGPER